MNSVTDLINSASPVGFAKYDIRRFTPRLKQMDSDAVRFDVPTENSQCAILMLSAELRVTLMRNLNLVSL